MPSAYGRDLDLNLLRVFAVVAETGSVTAAASRLYLTQPAVSAAIRRLTAVVGAPLATVPHRVADQLRAVRPHLKKTPLPFTIEPSPLDLLWPVATDDDEPCRFVRARIAAIAREADPSRTRSRTR
jgi:hypothetical protein